MFVEYSVISLGNLRHKKTEFPNLGKIGLIVKIIYNIQMIYEYLTHFQMNDPYLQYGIITCGRVYWKK